MKSRLAPLVVAAAVVGAALGLAPASQATVTVDELYDVSSGSLPIIGLGYGHGHGMSQYGARGSANAGLNAAQIMAFYYPGTSLAGGASQAIRVGLSTNGGYDMWVVQSSAMTVRSLADGSSAPLGFISGASVEVAASGGQTVVNQYYNNVNHTVATLNGGVEISDASGAPVALGVGSGTVSYRGSLRSVILSDGSRRALNVVGLDDYTQGVVPKEMPTSWPAAAVQSQAIAARTYALFEARANASSWSDICDTTYCQVYGGLSGETSGGNAAVAATSGQYVSYGGAPAFTQFSSSNGGWTSAGSQPYLDHHADPYDPAFSWSLSKTTAALASLYPSGGQITSIGITSREGGGQWNGRVLQMVLNGSAGQVTVSGYRVQSVLGLQSNWFTINLKNLNAPPATGPEPPPTAPPTGPAASASAAPVSPAPVPTGTNVKPVQAANTSRGTVVAPPLAPIDAQPVSAAAAIARVVPKTSVSTRPPWLSSTAAPVTPTRCWPVRVPFYGAVATIPVCSSPSAASPIGLGPIRLLN